MASTRTNLTAAVVVGLAAVSTAIGLTVWTVRNASVYRDIGRYATAQADLAASLILEGWEGAQPVVIGPDTTDTTTIEALSITPRLGAMLAGLPDYIVVLDKRGSTIYRSPEVLGLSSDDATLLADQLANLPAGGPAGLLSLGGLDERLLLVARDLTRPATPPLGRVVVGVPTQQATALPREYKFVFFAIVPLLVLGSAWIAYLAFGQTAQRITKISRDVAAITDGKSLHRRLNMDNAGKEFEVLVVTLNAMIERLETSFLGLRRFTADASHELKTPLAVLRADVERAMNEPSQNERLIALEEALHETTRMADLVESLLTLARADEGRFDIHREPIELKPLVQDVYETALILGEGAGVAVNLQFTADVTVMGDLTRLRQLFLNLVTNAIKYTPAGGKVDIGLGVHPDNVTFAVRDTGIGIAAADVPFIFERFWRADRVRSRMSERGGFGLGLSISQWIAQAHGGTLTASSRLGRGSLFTVTLPLPQQRPAT
ncbi:MAG TPA: HAMP domain-containing sensor histidine kinase [Gemmatimonadaceae bacterium]|nr:HAMP domain-containing sensor histidine kinase [Gemmatimonadaceae bacterium]